MTFVTAETGPSPDARGRGFITPHIISPGTPPARQAFTDGNGRAEVVFPGAGPGITREIERVVVRVANSSSIPFAFIYAGTEQDQNLRDGTSNGDLDFAEYNRGLRLPPNTDLRIVWTDADASVLATGVIQFLDIQYTRG